MLKAELLPWYFMRAGEEGPAEPGLADFGYDTRLKMGLRWWRYVLILSQPKRYLDDR